MSSNISTVRFHRLRQHSWMRNLVAETHLKIQDLIWPIFVRYDFAEEEIHALPGIKRHNITQLLHCAEFACRIGIPAVALFPIIDPAHKTPDGREILNPKGLLPQAIRAIKNAFPNLGVMTDVALDAFTSHGQDGLIDANGCILNDATVNILAQAAVLHAETGADVIAPSDMMDGRIHAIRQALDKEKWHNVSIISYAAKYASKLYGPFRHALQSSSNLGSADKKTYQISPSCSNQALRECAQDELEQADILMVKPAVHYMDVIARLRLKSQLPIFAYHVSGEYAMIKSAAQYGYLNETDVMLETLLGLKRAGADAIWTYFAPEAAQYLCAHGGVMTEF